MYVHRGIKYHSTGYQHVSVDTREVDVLSYLEWVSSVDARQLEQE